MTNGMKIFISLLLSVPLAIIIIILIDPISHPRSFFGTWSNASKDVYILGKNGLGTYLNDPDDKSPDTIAWHVENDTLVIYNQNLSDVYECKIDGMSFTHPKYKEAYANFNKREESISTGGLIDYVETHFNIRTLLFGNNKDSTTQNGEQVTDAATLEKSGKDNGELAENGVPVKDIYRAFGITNKNKEDFVYVTANYSIYDGEGKFDFYYPYRFFNSVREIEKYKDYDGPVEKGFEFTTDKKSSLTYAWLKTNSVDDGTIFYEKVNSDLIVESIIADRTDSEGRCIVLTGYSDENHEQVFYMAIRIDNNAIYLLDARFPAIDGDMDRQRKDYYAECLYRGAGFSISSNALRSYEDFEKDGRTYDWDHHKLVSKQSVTDAETVDW